MTNKIKGVFFDLVGTLIYVKSSVGEVYSLAAREYNIESDPKILNKNFIEEFSRLKQPNGNEYDEKEYWSKIVFNTFLKSGYDISPYFDKIFNFLYTEFSKESSWSIYPDAIHTLEKLQTFSDIIIGLISNFDNRLLTILSDLNLKQYFHTISYSGKTGYSKPDPRAFLIPLSEKALLAEEVIYVGDSLQNDYLPASELGLTALLIDREKERKNHKSNKINRINNLNQIFSYFHNC